MKRSICKGSKGQFSIIAALLVVVIIVAGVVTTYSLIRDNPYINPPNILGLVDEVNLSAKRILESTISYYGSIAQVTGNTSFAREMAANHLESGFINIAHYHPEWDPSFTFNSTNFSYNWFGPVSYSLGNITLQYSLNNLGVQGINYETSSALKVSILESADESETRVSVTDEYNQPELTLQKTNFRFYSYNFTHRLWELKYPVNNPTVFSNGTYILRIPDDVDRTSYLIQVVDSRGILVTAANFECYTYTFAWDNSLYSDLTKDVVVLEMLQNGTLRWLGQNIELANSPKPLPPIPIRSLRLNQTINGVNQEVPFQVEDWGSNYRIPLGLSSNTSVLSSRNLLVSLVNHNVSEITLWWDGRDIANQTSEAYENLYFSGDHPESGMLTNGILTLDIDNFEITSSLNGNTNTARFLRINGENPIYGSAPAYIIHHGVVRDIVQQEAEWSTGIPNCPDVYSQIVLTLPANATYYTYSLRLSFVNTSRSRTITELSAIQLSSGWKADEIRSLTENGTIGGYPNVAETLMDDVNNFYNFTSTLTSWKHHWSEYIYGTEGAGIMFTDESNSELYIFDRILNDRTGSLRVETATQYGQRRVVMEYKPVELLPVSFTHSLDVTWHGAVVTFEEEPIYPSLGGNIGLWVMVEFPPIVAVGSS